MIDKNLGNVERVMRFLAGLALGYWVLIQPHLTWVEWTAGVAALFLVLNAFFSRCYLWHMLGFDTCKGQSKNCPDNSPCNNTNLL